jgi:hypothetical protein
MRQNVAKVKSLEESEVCGVPGGGRAIRVRYRAMRKRKPESTARAKLRVPRATAPKKLDTASGPLCARQPAPNP